MGKKRKELTQAEIWDDSALVDSWNEAYEEYKFYHSIHARGEKVKDVLEAYERGEDEANMIDGQKAEKTTAKSTPASEDGEIEDGEVDAEPKTATEAAHTKRPENANTKKQVQHIDSVHMAWDASTARTNDAVSHGGPSMPDQLLAGTSDPALKSLMMSWYWAGYYSGFYEGQQQAKLAKTDGEAADGDGGGKEG